MMVYICTKFLDNISKGFSYRADANCILKFAKGHNSVKSVGGVLVLFSYTSSDKLNAIHLYQILLKYLIRFQSYGPGQ